MGRYVTEADMDVWCEKTIEEAPLSSLKTAAEHLLFSSRDAQRALEVERSVTAELRLEKHQLRVNLHMERDRVAALESRLAEAEARAAAAEERAREVEAKTENVRASLIGLVNDHAFRDVPLSWRTTLWGMLDKVGGGVPIPTTHAPEQAREGESHG